MGNSNNYFQLITEFKKNIDWLNQIIKGSKTDSVNIDGEFKPSISKDIEDQYAAIKIMVSGRVAYKNKAELDMAGQPPADKPLADVWNDPDKDKNGLYGWLVDHWEKSPYDPINGASVAGTEAGKNASSVQVGTKFSQAEMMRFMGDGLFPIVTDSEGKVLLGADDSGNIVAQLIYDFMRISRMSDISLSNANLANLTDHSMIPLMTDAVGKMLAWFNPVTGEFNCELAKSIKSENFDKTNQFKFLGGGEVTPIVTDSKGRVLVGVNNLSGKLVADIDQYAEHPDWPSLPNDKLIPKSDINHVIYYGQSLSVGAAGQHPLSTSQPYRNLTFNAGPKSSKAGSVGNNPGLDAFKPLVEDINAADYGNDSNRGETCCSGHVNHVTRLEAEEDGVDWQTGAQFLASAAGHGGYSIGQLKKGTTWYQVFLDHVTEAKKLADAAGKTYSVPCIVWIQGENDQSAGTAPDVYKQELVKLQLDMQSDIKAITGQSHRVLMMVYQTATNTIESESGSAPISRAQLEVAKENPDIHFVTSIYHLPAAPDSVHLTNVGYKWLGHIMGRTYKNVVVDGLDQPQLMPKFATATDNILTVKFSVPYPPLSILGDYLADYQDAGFLVRDNGGDVAITDIKVGLDTVSMSISRPLGTGAVVRYGLDHSSRFKNGAGGQLHDSAPGVFKHNGADYPLFNMAPHFELPIIPISE
ncbi:hypothetical protein VA249_30060 [Vibrio alfacsensis]|uniref:sialate O-acetylesterase n=1 Tax=Vibrio alfacsensis TaxID=1074311 RepID=UPI001BF0F225|nr:sialate O-acetylesterase [Vibrio alfacsensis]BBM66360.1 hypothetical protein VA249_30060 [Vibrio alfacsensis]